MQVELTNSNHSFEPEASEIARTRAAFMRALGVHDMVVVAPHLWASVVEDASRWRARTPVDFNNPKPPRLWTVRELAKQAGISDKAARGLARKLPTVCVAPSHCCGCLGGTRGCDIRFIAKDADAFVSVQRRQRAQR